MALLKFLKGNYASMSSAAIAEGQVLICGDTGEMFVDVAADKRVKIGDFITVANITALEALDATKVPTSRLYYVEEGNILARSNGTEWVQVNKQPTTEELKGLLGLGAMAYASKVSESHLDAALAEKVNAASEGNHSHANKALLDTYTQTEADLADAVAKKHEHANKAELDKIVAGDVAKWNGVVADHLTSADKTALQDSIGDVNTALGEEVNRAKLAEKANADAIAAIKDDANIDSFADVVAELAKKQNTGDYATKEEAQGYANAKDGAIAEAKAAGEAAQSALNTYKTDNDAALAGVKTTAEKGVSDAAAVAGDLAAHIEAAEGKYETKTDAGNKLTEAKGYTDTEVAKVQGEVDALETLVGALPEGTTATSVIEYVNKKTEGIATDAALGELNSQVSGLQTTVQEIKGDYLKAADKTELEGKITAAQSAAEGAVAAEKQRAEGIESGLRTDVDAIKGDYLKGSDKTELANAIAAEKQRAEGIEGGLETRLAAVEGDYLKKADKEALQAQIDLIMDNPDTKDVIDSISEFTQYIADHGTIAEGFRTDINANAAAIDEIEKDYLKAADKTALQGGIDAVAGRMTTAEGEIDALQADSHTHENADVLKGITAAKVAAWDAAEANAEAHADGLNSAMDTRVKALEAIDHDHANKAELDLIDSGDKAKWDAVAADYLKGSDKTALETAIGKKADQTVVDGIEDRVEALEAIDHDKILSDAKDYTDDLAEGAVATNAAGIASLVEQLTWGSF